MAQQPKTCKAVPANRGLEAKYRKALQRMIAEMHGSVEYWLTAAYRKDPPRMAILQPNVAFFLGRHLVQRGKGKADIRVDFPE